MQPRVAPIRATPRPFGPQGGCIITKKYLKSISEKTKRCIFFTPLSPHSKNGRGFKIRINWRGMGRNCEDQMF